MDTSRDKPMGTDGNPYIWLRYTTQFSSGGRTHTIEMGIPVPLGASAEVREQLIREAEIGMEQLSRHVENRVSQVLQQRNSRPPEPVRAQESSTLRPAQTPLQDAANRSAATRSTTPASSPAMQQVSAREEPQPLPLHEKQPSTPPVRQSVAANMPVTLGVQGDASSNMKLSQFMQVIRETWGLTPKQAMDLLNVKTLNGMNYREALRQLQSLVEDEARNATAAAKNPPVVSQPRPAGSNAPALSPIPLTGTTRGAQSTVTKTGVTHSSPPTPAPQAATPSKPVSPTPPVRPAPGALAGPANIPVIPLKENMLHEVPRVYKFDEEEEEREEKGEENEAQRAIARMKLDELKEVHGTSSASPGRLTALQNVLNSQITEEQLQRLIQSAWGATSVKKLKVDQVEALIAWAKEDYFVDEVEEVLALIDEEESYARGDW